MPVQKYFDGDSSFIGLRFGRLVITSPITIITKNKRKTVYVDTLCDCGTKKSILINSLNSGVTVSCGCFMRERQKEANIKHGLLVNRKKPKVYQVWAGMIKRCTNPNSKDYTNYGARGITVCDRWLNSFENFLEDMGEPETNQSIDRENNDLGYYKENCRWANKKTQNRNSRHNHIIEYNGEKKCLSEWAEILGLTLSALSSRLYRGWTIEQAFTIPTLRKGQGNLKIKQK